MLYVYAIREATAAGGAPLLAGVGDALTREIGAGGLEAVVSEFDAHLSQLSEDDMWAHEAVVEDLMEVGPVLPMRFGMILADEPEVVRMLGERSGEFSERLEQVRGAVELAVRAVIADDEDDGPPAPGSARPGSDYLLARLEQRRRAEQLARRLHDPLAAIARDSALSVGFENDTRVRAAYLVDEDDVDRFRALVARLEDSQVASALACTGPWPPYSFSAAGTP